MTIRSLTKSIVNHPAIAIIVAMAGCAVLTGCDRRSLPSYSAFVDIDPGGWAPGNPAELTPWPRDSVYGSEPYVVELAVRYTLSAPDTLRLGVTTEAFDITAHTDTIAIPLRHPTGRQSGTGSFGIYTVTTPLSPRGKLPEGLRIAVDPLSRVKGIASIGIILK